MRNMKSQNLSLTLAKHWGFHAHEWPVPAEVEGLPAPMFLDCRDAKIYGLADCGQA